MDFTHSAHQRPWTPPASSTAVSRTMVSGAWHVLSKCWLLNPGKSGVGCHFLLSKQKGNNKGTSENQRKQYRKTKKVDKYIYFAPEFSQLYLTIKTEIIILSDTVLNMWKKYLRWLYYKWVEDEGYKGK